MNYNRLHRQDNKARETFRSYHGYYPEHIPAKEKRSFQGREDAILGMYRNTRKPCSRRCCGNPRKWFGEVTRQEKLADLREKEQKDEIMLDI